MKGYKICPLTDNKRCPDGVSSRDCMDCSREMEKDLSWIDRVVLFIVLLVIAIIAIAFIYT